MTAKRVKKNYTVDYQIVDDTVLTGIQSKIDRAFDILFDALLENETREAQWIFYVGEICISPVDIYRQQGVYCEYGISNKKRSCEIL